MSAGLDTYNIEGIDLTLGEIAAKLPRVSVDLLRRRLRKNQWRTWAQLAQTADQARKVAADRAKRGMWVRPIAQ